MRMSIAVVVVGLSLAARADPLAHTPMAAGTVPAFSLVVNNRLVADDGRVVGTVAGVSESAFAVPEGANRFRVDGHVIDAATRVEAQTWPVAALEPMKTDSDTRLVRFEPDGTHRWAVVVHGARSVRPPDIATTATRVVAETGEAIRAYDDRTGALMWKIPALGGPLLAKGELVYKVNCNVPTNDHWLVGYAAADGKEVFRAPLAKGCDPTVAIDGTRILVVEEQLHTTTIFDLAGKQVLELGEIAEGHGDRAWAGSHPLGDDALVVTDKHIVRLDARGKVRWQHDPLANDFVAENDFADLPDGDVVIANYCAISDSGADVVRLRASDGAVVWRTKVPGLGVSHSKYAHHAYVELRGSQLVVVSQGSGGSFVEKLSLANGARETRCSFTEADSHCARVAP